MFVLAAIAVGVHAFAPRAHVPFHRIAHAKKTVPRQAATISVSKVNRIRLTLGLSYGISGLAVRFVAPNLQYAASSTAAVWTGFILSISFMEAVVKFKAPFLPRFFGLDVGRTVFPALNTIEAALCFTLWIMIGATPAVVILSALLCAQIFYLTPKLSQHGERAVLAALQQHPYLVEAILTESQREIYHRRCESISSTTTRNAGLVHGPGTKVLHLSYAVLEVVKLLSLAKFIAR